MSALNYVGTGSEPPLNRNERGSPVRLVRRPDIDWLGTVVPFTIGFGPPSIAFHRGQDALSTSCLRFFASFA